MEGHVSVSLEYTGDPCPPDHDPGARPPGAHSRLLAAFWDAAGVQQGREKTREALQDGAVRAVSTL